MDPAQKEFLGNVKGMNLNIIVSKRRAINLIKVFKELSAKFCEDGRNVIQSLEELSEVYNICEMSLAKLLEEKKLIISEPFYQVYKNFSSFLKFQISYLMLKKNYDLDDYGYDHVIYLILEF